MKKNVTVNKAMKPNFYKGQRVTCLDSSGKPKERGLLIEGKSYYVLDASFPHPDANGEVVILLEGIDCAFFQGRFIATSVEWKLEEEIAKALYPRKHF